MNLRPTALLLLAGILAFVAALRFRTAVHPEELSDPAPYKSFAAAAEQVPALRSVRVHSASPDVVLRIRRVHGQGAFRRITDVESVQAEMRRGRLAVLPIESLKTIRQGLRAGTIPTALPPAPDVRPYFSDAGGAYPCEVLVNGVDAVDVLGRAVPEATLRGDPVPRRADESRRAGVLRAAIAALVALLLAALFHRAPGTSLEQRLLCVLVPLAVLGWSGRGVDMWTLPALALVAMAPAGAPLLSGAALVLFPALSIQRMGWVFLCAGLLRIWPRRRSPVVSPGWKGWTAACLIVVAGWFGIRAVPAPRVGSPTGGREPAVLLVDAGTRTAAAARLRSEGFRQIVGGEDIPEGTSAPLDQQRLLESIYHAAKSRARTATGDELAALESVIEASARDGIYVPRSLRARRTAVDGRDVLWVHDAVDREDLRFESHALYRDRSEVRLREQARLAGSVVFALAVLLRVLSRRRRLLLDLAIALIALVVGASWLYAGDAAEWGGLADPLLPTLAVACFAASWSFVLVLAVVALVLPGALAVHLGAFALAACLRYLVRDGDDESDPSDPAPPALEAPLSR